MIVPEPASSPCQAPPGYWVTLDEPTEKTEEQQSIPPPDAENKQSPSVSEGQFDSR